MASFSSKLSPATGVASEDFVSEEAFLQDVTKRLVRPAIAKVELVRNSFLFIAKEIRLNEIIKIYKSQFDTPQYFLLFNEGNKHFTKH